MVRFHTNAVDFGDVKHIFGSIRAVFGRFHERQWKVGQQHVRMPRAVHHVLGRREGGHGHMHASVSITERCERAIVLVQRRGPLHKRSNVHQHPGMDRIQFVIDSRCAT